MHVANTGKSPENSQPLLLDESPSLHFSSNLFVCLVMACHFHMEAILLVLFDSSPVFLCQVATHA